MSARETPGDAQYAVTAPLVIARTPDGDVYLYRHGRIPNNIDPKQLEMLVSERFVQRIGA